MRVTKIVREFVEEEVNKKYPMPELDKVAVAQLDKYISIVKERISKEAGEFIFNKMKEAGLQFEEGVTSVDNVNWRYLKTVNAVRAAHEEASNKVKTKRERAIKDILISLELGGTKQELMEMLANLPD